MITVDSAPLPGPRLPFHAGAARSLAMCIFDEASSEIPETQYAVGCVVKNRVASGRFGVGWTGMILKPYQFFCFNQGDPNGAKLMEPTNHELPEVW